MVKHYCVMRIPRGSESSVTIVGPSVRDVELTQRDVMDGLGDSTWGTVRVATPADHERYLQPYNLSNLASLVRHGRYMRDLRAFRAAHGYAASYQEGWQTLGPRAETEASRAHSREVGEWYAQAAAQPGGYVGD